MWSIYSEMSGQFTPKNAGQFDRIFHITTETLSKFSINYFINPHLKELVEESLRDAVEKYFNELANGEMKDFVKMIPLERRYDRYFEELLRFTKIYPYYKAVITNKNSL